MTPVELIARREIVHFCVCWRLYISVFVGVLVFFNIKKSVMIKYSDICEIYCET